MRTRHRAARCSPAALAAALALAPLTGCGAARLASWRTNGCTPFDRTAEVVRLEMGNTIEIAQPCPSLGAVAISSAIRLTGRPDGLGIGFDVRDENFTPGALRQDRGARDAVVVFPSGEGPGRPSVELATTARQGGYAVEDVVPWESLGVGEAGGDLVLHLSLFDRDARGAESEVRLRIGVRVPPPT